MLLGAAVELGGAMAEAEAEPEAAESADAAEGLVSNGYAAFVTPCLRQRRRPERPPDTAVK